MADEIDDLKTIISVSDLLIYKDNDALLNYAISWAISEINKRRGYTPLSDGDYEPKYRTNVIQGAVDYLSRIGGAEISTASENGISTKFREVPSWLQSVIPLLKVI